VVDLIAAGRVTLPIAAGRLGDRMCRTEDGLLDLGYERGHGSSPFVPRRLMPPCKGYTITIRFVGTYSVGSGP
jgi:hypothetical protein